MQLKLCLMNNFVYHTQGLLIWACLQSYTSTLGHLLNNKMTSVHESSVWHLQRSVKCVGSARCSRCFVF